MWTHRAGMQAQEKTLTDFLGQRQQFIIPIYQRTYSWTSTQCKKLWEDIQEAANNENIAYHFMGSIVSIKKTLNTSEISQQTIIDGQQRISTILLLISALVRAIPGKERSEELQESYLINRHGKDELKYKMILTQQDKETLINIIEDRPNAKLSSNRIRENFEFFKGKITNSEPEKIYAGIRKLMIVDIALDEERDNPQLIFESLNSTGLELSQADLIRNYVLMGLNPKQQEELYHNYWRAMEQNFGQTDYRSYFDRFMRDYLTIKTGTIPNIKNVYETFKEYFIAQGGLNNVDDVIADIHKYSTYFVKIALGKEEQKQLSDALSDLNDLNIDVAYPFLLQIYNDFEEKRINLECCVNILNLIQSYVFRRFICGIPTNSLNKTFATLYKSIDTESYFDSLKASFILMANYKRFPSDTEFIKELKEKDLYNIKNRNFWLRRFENHERKERVQVDDYTVEHIMPQNSNLSREWKEMLGENWEEVHENYLHTIGNLTLTGYNSELSDKAFVQKKAIEGGFDNSPLRLNKSLQQVSVWNEDSIKERTEELAKTMMNIWPYPSVSEETLEKYTPKPENTYTIDNFPSLTKPPMNELFNTLRKRIVNIDASVREMFSKHYVSYKAPTNFVDLVPKKDKIRLFLNMDYEEIHDPKNLCINVTDKGHWGTGNIEINLDSYKQLDDVFALITQSFEKCIET